MGLQDETRTGGQRDRFLTTHWTLIESIQRHRDKDKSLIGFLLERYWKPVYCYLRRRGYANEEAKDLTQAFFHEIVLTRHLIERADRTKGRFRSLLLHALDLFLIDQGRKEHALKRIPKEKLVPWDIVHEPELPALISQRSPEECFAYAWKAELLDRTLRQVQADCRQRGLQRHWCLFRDKVIEPALNDEEPPPMKALSARYGIKSESTAFNMLLTVKRRFRKTLRRNLANTVLAEDEIDDEWREILSLVGTSEKERPQPCS